MKDYRVGQTPLCNYRTISDALAAIKNIERDLPASEPVRIVVDGLLHLEEPLKITSKQMPARPVTIEGADTRSGFSGGVHITEFTHWKDNIWRTKIPNLGYTRHLYIDGKLAKRPSTRARKAECWDNVVSDDFMFSNLPGEPERKTVIRTTSSAHTEVVEWSGIATMHTEIADWKNTRDLEMVYEVGWVHRIVPIEAVQPLPDGRLYIKPLEPAFRSARLADGMQIGGCPSYIDNVFELLGEPLEWYFDRNEKMLYVGFAEGDTPDQHEIIVPLVEQLMEITGDLENKLCNLCFRNLIFQHTTWLFPQQYGLPEIQANQIKFTDIPEGLIKEKPYEGDHQKVIAALRVMAANGVSFEGCTFTALGTGALQYEFGTQNCSIERNHFYEIGGSAVSMGDFYLERAHHPKDRREIVRGINVRNNLIHDTGRDFRGSVAIIAGYVQDVTIAHNEIFNVPYSAISLGWGWGETDISVGPMCPTPWTEPTVCMRNHIIYNHIHHCMMQLFDGGAIYTLGCMPGTAIIGNYIHESSGYQGESYNKVSIGGRNVDELKDPATKKFGRMQGSPGGIYLDEGTQGVEVSNNVLHDVPIPVFYHNMIDFGYKTVSFLDNTFGKRPGDEEFPTDITDCAGIEPLHRFSGV